MTKEQRTTFQDIAQHAADSAKEVECSMEDYIEGLEIIRNEFDSLIIQAHEDMLQEEQANKELGQSAGSIRG